MKNSLKLIALLIAAVMTLAMFAACQGGSSNTTTASETTGAATTTGKETEKETETDPVTTEEVTTEEVTTEEVTTEEVKKERYDVYKWTFDDASDLGWVSSNVTEITSGEDGTMHLLVKGGDPNITTKKIPGKINCEDVEYIVMRVKNKTDAYTAQLFINTSTSPGPSEQYSYKFDYEYADEDDEWEIIEIDTLDINGWDGILRDLRLDYTDGSSGECIVDYIALQTEDKSKAGAVDTETEADPRAGKQVLFKYDFTQLTADDLFLGAKSEEYPEDIDKSTRWNFSSGISDAYVENGHFVAVIGAEDPFMASPVMTEAFDCEAVSAIVIKICNKTETPMGQFFFVSGGMSDYSGTAQVRFTTEHYGADNDIWEEVVINPFDSSNWYGELTSIRIDPTEARDGLILLDYCELYG